MLLAVEMGNDFVVVNRPTWKRVEPFDKDSIRDPNGGDSDSEVQEDGTQGGGGDS